MQPEPDKPLLKEGPVSTDLEPGFLCVTCDAHAFRVVRTLWPKIRS